MLKSLVSLLGMAVLLIGGACSEADSRAGGPITGPIQHNNLAAYLIKSNGPAPEEKALTLSDALEKGVVTVHETGEVNSLAVDNTSDYPIFIQAGELVKGGRQDRALAMDLLIPPKSENVPIPSFCVEAGRWSGRSGESSAEFEVSSKALATKELKMAALHSKSQGEVWEKVDAVNRKLGDVLGEDVTDSRSSSSLQLALENDKVQATIDAYITAMNEALSQEKDVVGIAFAINGEINSADVYRSPAMFQKCLPKLIEAAAIEALAASDESPGELPSVDEVSRWLDECANLEVTDEQWGTGIIVRSRDSEHSFVNELRESDNEEAIIHWMVLKK